MSTAEPEPFVLAAEGSPVFTAEIDRQWIVIETESAEPTQLIVTRLDKATAARLGRWLLAASGEAAGNP